MAKKTNKKAKVAKAAKPAAKKNAKPAAKKSAPKSKPAKKNTKPVAKKATPKKAAPAKAKKAAPAKVKKAAPAKVKKAAPKADKAKKEVKKVLKKEEKVAPKATKEKELKKNKAALTKPSKEDSKKAKPGKEELENEGLELDEPMMDSDIPEGAIIDDDDDDFLDGEAPEARGKGRPPKKKKLDKKNFDSEVYKQKNTIKIDLSKPLIKKQAGPQPKPFVNTNDNRTRYNDSELQEFKEIILKKLEEAKADYELLKQTLSHKDDHGTDDTSPTFKLLEDGSDVLSKEETAQLAARQEKYIISLQNALIRIENKTYGVCRITGKLIPKERLRSVPHATLGIDAKLNQNH